MRPNTSPVWPATGPPAPAGTLASAPAAWWTSAWPAPGRAAWPQAWPPGGRRPSDHPSSGTLRQVLASNPELLAHSRPVMEYLFDQVRHSQSVVVLADRRGMLMHTLGEPALCGQGRARGADQRRILARGPPGHQRHRHGAGRGLRGGGARRRAFSGAQQLSHLRGLAHPLGHGRVAGHPRHLGRPPQRPRPHAGPGQHGRPHDRKPPAGGHLQAQHPPAPAQREPEGIGSVAEGIVAVSADGWIVGANRVALAQLGLHARATWAPPCWSGCWMCGWMTCSRTTSAAPSSRRRCACTARRLAVCPGADGRRLGRHPAHGPPPAPAAVSQTTPWPGSTPATPAGAPPPTRPAAWWASRLRCWCRANRAWARRCLRARCTPAARAAMRPLCGHQLRAIP